MKWREDSFDGNMLGCKVLKIWLPPSPEAPDVSALLRDERPGLACCFAAHSRANIAALERAGFSLISVRQNYECPLGGAAPAARPAGVEIVFRSEAQTRLAREDLRALAAIIGATSRYFKDERIPADRSRRLYEAWLTNSLEGGYADEAILACVGGRVAGVLTLKVRDARGRIDLMGVLPEFQSRGLGSALLACAAGKLRALGARAMDTVTEAENVAGCRLYQKNGFVLTETELVYHWHRPPTP